LGFILVVKIKAIFQMSLHGEQGMILHMGR